MDKNNRLEIDLEDVGFVIGFPCSFTIPTYTAFSLANTLKTFTELGIKITYAAEIGNSIVHSARNNVVHNFLKIPEADKLIWIDSDMQWEEKDLLRLCCWSKLYPVVGALYSTKIEGNQKIIGDFNKESSKLVQFNEHGLASITGMGLGFCIIDRSVFEKMMPLVKTYVNENGENVHGFYECPIEDGRLRGEDIKFLKLWTKDLGESLWVDPDINPGHIGTKVFRANARGSLLDYNNRKIKSMAVSNQPDKLNRKD